MSRKRETLVRAKVRKILRDAGWQVTPYPASIAGYRGVADFICCTPSGKYAEVEVKCEAGAVSPIQLHRAKEISRHNGIYIIAKENCLDYFVSAVTLLS